jgi:hypothetical protein
MSSFQAIKTSTKGFPKCDLYNFFEIKTIFYKIIHAQLLGTAFVDREEMPLS